MDFWFFLWLITVFVIKNQHYYVQAWYLELERPWRNYRSTCFTNPGSKCQSMSAPSVLTCFALTVEQMVFVFHIAPHCTSGVLFHLQNCAQSIWIGETRLVCLGVTVLCPLLSISKKLHFYSFVDSSTAPLAILLEQEEKFIPSRQQSNKLGVTSASCPFRRGCCSATLLAVWQTLGPAASCTCQ